MRLAQAITAGQLSAHADDTKVANVKTLRHGLPITIEHKKGSDRTLHNDAGKQVYKVRMHNDYGYIDNTKGRDGDEVDVMLGPSEDAEEVYIVHMKDMGPDPSQREDEDKVMMGFPSADLAKSAFHMHYPREFYEGMTAMPVDQFLKTLKQAQKPHAKKKLTAQKSKQYGGKLSAKCPQCHSDKHVVLMPADFETAKCTACNRTFQVGA